ncbi:MAG: hypothetical protein F6J90_36340 [Moorea sp. SIOASIH]|nr:hypothetical protein [Moorena sp. SIOASIH]
MCDGAWSRSAIGRRSRYAIAFPIPDSRFPIPDSGFPNYSGFDAVAYC